MPIGTGATTGAMAAWLTAATIIGGGANSGAVEPAAEVPVVVVEQTATIDLAAYQWENRLVLIFAPTSADASLQAQLATFSGRAGEVVDRDLILGYFPAAEDGSFGGEPTAVSAGEALREELGIAPERFTVLLIGKDGGVKLRSATPLTADRIFGTIDSMPMRQQEMR
jgi:hypothetical protein